MKRTFFASLLILSSIVSTPAYADVTLAETLKSNVKSLSLGGENSSIEIRIIEGVKVTKLISGLKKSKGLFDYDIQKNTSVDQIISSMLNPNVFHPEYCDEFQIQDSMNESCTVATEGLLTPLRTTSSVRITYVFLNGDDEGSDFKTVTLFITKKHSKVVTEITFKIHDER